MDNLLLLTLCSSCVGMCLHDLVVKAAMEAAEHRGLEYLEVSALTGLHVQDLLENIENRLSIRKLLEE